MTAVHRLLRVALGTVLVTSGLVHPPRAAAVGSVVLVGAADIASCGSTSDQKTASLLDGIRGTVFTAGDNAYPNGTAREFRACYAPTWGRHRGRTRPAPGNHDYHVRGAAGYFGYFGVRAGPPGRGWYAYSRGAWRIYSLNSNCDEIGGCGIGSRQQRWLAADLAAHPRKCVLAYWHHPRFSSGMHGNQTEVQGLWQTLFRAGAEIVVNGHDHDYERFAPQDAMGRRDVARGIREFVVGTGGAGLRGFSNVKPNSEVRQARSAGVLKLVLGAGFYRWHFISAATSKSTDSGRGTCH
jgi:hypothetical protein